MFRIRHEQMEALVTARKVAADCRIISYARQRFPSNFLHIDDAELRGLVDRVRVSARSYGITGEHNVAIFLDLTVMYGEDFHQALWASRVLQDENLDSDSKVNSLRRLVFMTGVKI